MKTKSKILTLLALSAGAIATTATINKFFKISATSKNLLAEPQGLCYQWRLGNIYYTKSGSGKPLLLIHDLSFASSGYEWESLIARLKTNYTIYTIDLLGCGRSEKPNMIYTNYLYVQLISDFVKSVIGHRVSVIATGESISIPLMACANNPDLFDQLMLINPLSLLEFSQIPGKTAKYYKTVVDLPVIGTLLYHIASRRQEISNYFTTYGFQNPYSIKPAYIENYYESAHLGLSPKSMYASIKCNYTKYNITNALKKVDNSIYLVGGMGLNHIENILEEYKSYNSAIEISILEDAKGLPQLENPVKLEQLIKTYFG